MNKHLIQLCTAGLLATIGQAALADTHPGKTREQVKAELAQARLKGELPIGEDGLTPRQRFPQLYPAQTALAANKKDQPAAH